jgi:hypothetical protein
MLQELPSVVQYNIHVSHQIAVCIQQVLSLESSFYVLLLAQIPLLLRLILINRCDRCDRFDRYDRHFDQITCLHTSLITFI